MTCENDGVAAYMQASGIKHVVTCTTAGQHAPGSYHKKFGTASDSGKQGRATDLAVELGAGTDPRLIAIFRAFAPVESQLAELFYSGADHFVKDGVARPISELDPEVKAIHWDHVHVGLPLGAPFLQWQGPPVPTPKPEEEMPQPTACACPSGKGAWVLQPNGDVETIAYDPNNPPLFHGSMADYPQEKAVPGRVFIGITPTPQPAADGMAQYADEYGYTIISNDLGSFRLRKP